MDKSTRRLSMAERRPSNVQMTIPQLAYLELPPSKTPETCDVLIAGTGLVHSILAAALSWAGSDVLHIDANSNYGDSSATLTIDQLKEWVKNVNANSVGYKQFNNASLHIPRGKEPVSKDYGIDLSPKVMFAKSDLIGLLVKSKVFRYLEFQPLSTFHVYENDNIEKLNQSKEDIFLDRSLGLTEKRSLMRFIKFAVSWSTQKEVWGPYRERSIEEFLTTHFKLGAAQVNEIIFSLGLCFTPDLRTPEALQRVKRYLESFDVYGHFPVLYTRYGGAGEVSQGFCRSAAVAGATYKLQTQIKAYDPKSGVVSLSDGSEISVKEKIVVSPAQTSLEPPVQEYEVNRLVAVVDKDCKEWVAEGESAGIVVFPTNSLPSKNKYAVQVIVMGPETKICPDGQAVWYLSTVEKGTRGREDLREALKLLESSIMRESNIDKLVPTEDIEIKNGMPSISSVKLGTSLMNFQPDEKLNYVLRLEYTQFTNVTHFGVVNPSFFDRMEPPKSKLSTPWKELADKVLFSSMPSSEISYDGVITEAKALYSKITGSDDDFFDVDFEDEEDAETQGVNDEVKTEKTEEDVLLMEDMTTSPLAKGEDIAIESDDEVLI